MHAIIVSCEFVTRLFAVTVQDCCTATRVEAKAKLFGMLPEDLKRIVGHSTAKKGILK